MKTILIGRGTCPGAGVHRGCTPDGRHPGQGTSCRAGTLRQLTRPEAFHLAGQGCGLHTEAGVDHHDRGAPGNVHGELPTVLVEGVPGRSLWNSGIIIRLIFEYTLLTL